LQAQLFPTAVRERVTWGPFTLNPANGEHKSGGIKLDKQSDMIEENLAGICKGCMVLQARTDITDKDGNRMGLDKQIYVHHIILAGLGDGKSLKMAPMSPERLTCAGASAGISLPGMNMMGGSKPATDGMSGHSHSKRQGFGLNSFSLFIAKGNEGDSTTFGAVNSTTIKSGYWVGKNDRFASAAEVVNYKTVPQEVYLSIDMEYINIDGARPADYLDVAFGTLQVQSESCKGLNLFPPKDREITYKSADWIVRQNGYLVGITPHMHDGGLNIKIFVNDKLACHSDAIYGGLGDGGTSVNGEKWETITTYSPCTEAIKLNKGDKVKMTSDYDLRKHKLRPDSANAGGEAEAMALTLFQFALAK